MSNFITCRDLSKAFGAQRLFENISLAINSGDRVGVIGPNGSGKSTLLKIICGLEEVDAGELQRPRFTRFSYLAQEDVFEEAASIEDNMLGHLDSADLSDTEKYTKAHTLLSMLCLCGLGNGGMGG